MKIAVVGGGIAGVSAAAALATSGAEVVLFEAENALGYHASGRSAAMYEKNYGNATIRALNAVSGPLLEQAGVLSPRGLLMVALAEEEAAFDADLAGMGLEEISLDAARACVPILSPDITRAALHEGAQDIDTHALLMGYAKTARNHGATVLTGTKVLGLRPGWTVETEEGSLACDAVVNAAGAWADQVAVLAGVTPLGLQAYRRSMARLPAPGGWDVSNWPMLFGPGETWYAKPDAGGWIVSPADEDPVGAMDAWADDTVLAEGIARYSAHVTEPVTRVETNWAGLRTFAKDRALVIGEAPDAARFFWLAGQGGYGFQTGPAAAAHLAHLVTSAPAVVDRSVAACLSPERFRVRLS